MLLIALMFSTCANESIVKQISPLKYNFRAVFGASLFVLELDLPLIELY